MMKLPHSRLRWLLVPLLLTPGVALGLAIAFTVVHSEGSRETVTYRWGDVTVQVPSRQDIRVYREVDRKTGEPYMIVKMVYSWDGALPVQAAEAAMIDKMGKVVSVSGSFDPGNLSSLRTLPGKPVRLKKVLGTVKLEPLDVRTAPWPYNGQPPEERQQERRIRFPVPHPGSGFVIGLVIADPGGQIISLQNLRSVIAVQADTGVITHRQVHPDDEAAVANFLAAVELVP